MINTQPVLQDDVIQLKMLEASHTEALFIMRSDEQLCKKAGLKVDKSRFQTQYFISKISKKIREGQFLYWGIFKQDILVGVISLWSIDYEEKSGELGYFIGTDYLRQGYMSRAIKLVVNHTLIEGPLKIVTAYIETTNKASQRLVEKLGFIKKGESLEEDMADTFVQMYRYEIEKLIK